MNEIASTLLSIFIIFLIYGFVDYLFFLWRLRKYKKVRKELGYDEEGEEKKSGFRKLLDQQLREAKEERKRLQEKYKK